MSDDLDYIGPLHLSPHIRWVVVDGALTVDRSQRSPLNPHVADTAIAYLRRRYGRVKKTRLIRAPR